MPFPDGADGGADDGFAAVVFDEAFIRAAAFHEPSAEERLLAAAAERAEAEAARARVGAADEDADEELRYREEGEPVVRRPAAGYAVRAPHTGLGGYGWPEYGGYRSHSRWHRTVAWVLALVMGIGVVALTFTAVYRSAAAGSRRPVPAPATGQVDPQRSPAATSSAAP